MSKIQHKQQVPSYLLDLLDNETDKKHFEEYYFSPPCVKVRQLLVRWLKERIKTSVERSDKATTFEKPAWAEYQAAQTGARQECRELINTINR